MIAPDFVTELDAMAVMKVGRLIGGPGLFRGSLLQTEPQFGVDPPIEFAKPLKAEGAGPWLSVFFLDHCEPQK